MLGAWLETLLSHAASTPRRVVAIDISSHPVSSETTLSYEVRNTRVIRRAGDELQRVGWWGAIGAPPMFYATNSIPTTTDRLPKNDVFEVIDLTDRLVGDLLRAPT